MTTRSVVRDDLTDSRFRLLVDPALVEELGGDHEVRSMLAGAAPWYRCLVCGNEGRLDRDVAASLVILVACGPAGAGETMTVGLSHPGCSDSRFRLVSPSTPLSRHPDLPGTVWLRPADADPAAVLVLAVSASSAAGVWEDEPGRGLAPTLVAHGFATLSGPESPLRQSATLTAWYAGGQMTVRDRSGTAIWSGPIAAPQDWSFAAVRAGRIGLVIAAVPAEAEDSSTGLAEALTTGWAAGVAIRLVEPGQAAEESRVERSLTDAIRPYPLSIPRPRKAAETSTPAIF